MFLIWEVIGWYIILFSIFDLIGVEIFLYLIGEADLTIGIILFLLLDYIVWFILLYSVELYEIEIIIYLMENHINYINIIPIKRRILSN